MTKIIVTGAVGTGKTTLSKLISQKTGYKYIEVNSLIKDNHLYDSYDDEKDCFVVNEKKLAKELEKIKGDVVIDSHMSHYMNPKKVEVCIVTKCELKKLRKRLEERGYAEKKIKENMQAEIFNICFEEAKKIGHKPIVIETSNGLSEEVINLLKL